jgi:hypothetical protein
MRHRDWSAQALALYRFGVGSLSPLSHGDARASHEVIASAAQGFADH